MSRTRRLPAGSPSLSADADHRVVRALVSAGADPTAPRLVRHYLVCPDRQGAHSATLQLREAGFEAASTENPTAAGWIIVAERPDRLDDESIALARSFLELVAERAAGTYDGWHTDLLDDEVDAPTTGLRRH